MAVIYRPQGHQHLFVDGIGEIIRMQFHYQLSSAPQRYFLSLITRAGDTKFCVGRRQAQAKTAIVCRHNRGEVLHSYADTG